MVYISIRACRTAGSSRIIGEDKALSIKVGAEAGDPSSQDVIMVRGASADVDRAVKEILRVAEDAKNDAIVSSYVSESNPSILALLLICT